MVVKSDHLREQKKPLKKTKMTIGPVKVKKSGGGGDDATDADNPLPPPPDGGWGWVVVFASLMIHIIADGVTYTFGIFYVELQNHYGVGKAATSWIVSIMVGMTLGCGPISSALTNKYGCRAVTITGAIIASIGFAFSLLAPTITMLYFTIGVCAGLGFGLMYLPAIVCVTCYFEKLRAFATGVAVCGSGLGTFIFAPFTQFLVETYRWKGAMLLIAGFVLNCAVFGALFRPPEVRPKRQKAVLPKEKTAVQEITKSDATAAGHLIADIDDDNNQINPPQKNGYVSLNINESSKKSTSAQNLAENPVMKRQGSSQSLVSREKSPELPGPFYRKDVFYRGSLLNIPQYRSNPSMYTASITHIPHPEPMPANSSKLSSCFSQEVRDAFKEMMDFTLLKDPVFLLFAVSNFCTSIGFNVPYLYIKDRALLLRISDNDSSFLLAIIGISNTISRVVLGFLSDKTWLNRLWLYNSALTVCGLATAFSSFCQDYPSQAFYTAVFGATTGAYVSLTSVILVDLVGLEKLTNAFGLLLLFQGVAASIGAPIAGGLYDMLKSYNPGFYMAGIMIAASGAMLFAIPLVQHCGRSNLADKSSATAPNGATLQKSRSSTVPLKDSSSDEVA